MVNGKKEDEPVQTLSEIYQDATTDGKEYTFNNVMSASVLQNRDTNNPSTSIPETDELSVSQIVRNEDGGYDVTFLIDDTSRTVAFSPDDCNEAPGMEECSANLGEDGSASIWTYHSVEEGTGQLGPSSSAIYHNVKHFQVHGTTSTNERFRHKQLFVFGITTPKAGQPKTGTATYYGQLVGNANRMTEGGNTFRQRITGSNVRLVANFDMSTPSINGEITSIRGTSPGQSVSERPSWQNSRFVITGTGVNSKGQFTATVTGMDDSDADDVESVRGFMGKLTAQLFGPNAEEIGGSLNASRDLDGDDNDLVLYGYISGNKIGPAKMLGSEGVSVGVVRNFMENKTELQKQGRVTMMRNDGDSGWVLTANGRTVEFDDTQYDVAAGNYFSLRGRDDSTEPQDYLWSEYGGNFQNPTFEHFDVKGWIHNHGNEQIWPSSYIVHGDRTPVSSLSTTTAIYRGNVDIRQFPSDRAIRWSERTQYLGDLRLTANFDDAMVNGEITALETRQGNRGSYSAIQGGASFNATIDGHNFTANAISGTGDFSGLKNGNVYGSFFGPAAQEAGGVLDAGLGDDLMIGYFGTAQAN